MIFFDPVIPGRPIEFGLRDFFLIGKRCAKKCHSNSKLSCKNFFGDQSRYSVWFKPAGLMSQGTKYGDHCSLLRLAGLFFKSKRKVFPVHRLDREASGMVLIAHDKTAAGKLSRLFRSQQIIKRYRAQELWNFTARSVTKIWHSTALVSTLSHSNYKNCRFYPYELKQAIDI